ncbi:Protein of unknown function [Gryllus bimaculatus]|nr:Protein of unknown function [Gryllus bimaculatus]
MTGSCFRTIRHTSLRDFLFLDRILSILLSSEDSRGLRGFLRFGVTFLWVDGCGTYSESEVSDVFDNDDDDDDDDSKYFKLSSTDSDPLSTSSAVSTSEFKVIISGVLSCRGFTYPTITQSSESLSTV